MPVGAVRLGAKRVEGRRERLHFAGRVGLTTTNLGDQPMMLGQRSTGSSAQTLFRGEVRGGEDRAGEGFESTELAVGRLAEKVVERRRE